MTATNRTKSCSKQFRSPNNMHQQNIFKLGIERATLNCQSKKQAQWIPTLNKSLHQKLNKDVSCRSIQWYPIGILSNMYTTCIRQPFWSIHISLSGHPVCGIQNSHEF